MKVADFFKVTPEQCVVIDDSASAISAAKHLGFRTILFGTDVHDFQSISVNVL
jgi:HAD superfamily hydrolase (TIGR01509 family)